MAHKKNKDTHVTATSVKMHSEVKINNGNLQGELTCKSLEEPFKFTSLMSMIEMMETTFDAKGFPEKHMLPRTFGKAKPRIRKHEVDLEALVKEHSNKRETTSGVSDPGESSVTEPKNGADKTCNFDISVRFRHNAEWQGSIRWVEKDVTKQFSSIIELLKLIDNALEE